MDSRTLARKLRTFKSCPLAVYKKYLHPNILIFVGKVPKPYNEDYNLHWNFTSFKDKVVLDLGADWGSTAKFFLEKGAHKVIAVEADKSRIRKLAYLYRKDDRVVPVYGFIKDSSQIDALIEHYSPDLAKVDIEGWEKCLPQAHNISKVREWLIEAHTPQIYSMLYNFFKTLGYKVEVYDYVNGLKILHCRK